MFLTQNIIQSIVEKLNWLIINSTLQIYALTIIASIIIVPYYLIKIIIDIVNKFKNKKYLVSKVNNLILCKKCGNELAQNILCNDCSDEILTLYLLDKIPVEEIEECYNLLPNTVLYWYNYCASQNGGNFLYLNKCKYNINYSDKPHILRRCLAFVIDIFVFEIVVIFLVTLM